MVLEGQAGDVEVLAERRADLRPVGPGAHRPPQPALAFKDVQ
jgi:hypothetical protein